MNLFPCRIGLPALRIDVRIHHATPRVPTVFERILLELCDRFGGGDGRYNNISLERIFEDILGVVDPGPLVTPAIYELVSLDVLRCKSAVDSLDVLTLRDLEMTDRGRLMFAEDMLPAKSQENDEVVTYDPVRKRLLSASEEKAYRPHAPAVSLNASVFSEVFPEEQIRDQVLSGAYPWWSSASRIERLERRAIIVSWRDTPATVVVDRGALRIDFKDVDHTAYLNSLPAPEVYERFLSPLLGVATLPAEDVARLPLGDVEAIDNAHGIWLPIPQALSESNGNARYVLVDRSSHWLQWPCCAERRQAIIGFDPGATVEGATVTWNESSDGCLVVLKGVYPLSDVLVASDRVLVRGQRIQIKIGEEMMSCPLALRSDGTGADHRIASTLDMLAQILEDSGEMDADLVPLFWKTETDYCDRLVSRLISTARALGDALQFMRDRRRRYSEISGSVNAGIWDRCATAIVIAYMERTDHELTLDEVSDVANAIAQCRITTRECVTRIVVSVIAKVQCPVTLQDFEILRRIFKNGGLGWEVPYPSRIYTTEVLSSVAREFPHPRMAACFPGDNDFDKGISELVGLHVNLTALIGAQVLQGLASDDDYLTLLKRSDANMIFEKSEAWLRCYTHFMIHWPEMESLLSESLLAELRAKVERILVPMRKLVGGLDPRFHAVFIVDTSALIDRPELLKTLTSREFLVVSKRVIEELDDKKSNEELRPRIAEVTRLLQSFPEQQIHFCEGDMSLLSPDYRLKGDNLILSVAIRYRKHSPVIVTNDNNLTLKAKAEGITAMSVTEFEMRPRQVASAQVGPKGPTNNSQPTKKPPRRRR